MARKPVILVGYCDVCGGSMVQTGKGVECENCGNRTFRAK
jgi:exosome complex RNA-binding protein Csl4